ncbi:hypothetical protein [Streptomyces viridochromogenes]|uniref:hypothetical protein n=1 Tax=Streptomyces viridochromogenes TaxID=1938 RepID=UPI00069DE88B|nr:hypothetical protein [Streptomyces viridochromogenes]KOG22020.1 hypothetical protein ADK36_13880 [Streptomyces viridochromogenes]
MSDLDALGNPEHECDEGCGPYEPQADRNLEDLDESAHIDALYEELNLVREHVALLLLALAQVEGPTIGLQPRGISVLLDLSQTEAEALLGRKHHDPQAVVNHAISVAGEDGYVGRAMEAVFRAQIMRASAVTSPDEDDEQD